MRGFSRGREGGSSSSRRIPSNPPAPSPTAVRRGTGPTASSSGSGGCPPPDGRSPLQPRGFLLRWVIGVYNVGGRGEVPGEGADGQTGGTADREGSQCGASRRRLTS